jgi:hypothetical protein
MIVNMFLSFFDKFFMNIGNTTILSKGVLFYSNRSFFAFLPKLLKLYCFWVWIVGNMLWEDAYLWQ